MNTFCSTTESVLHSLFKRLTDSFASKLHILHATVLFINEHFLHVSHDEDHVIGISYRKVIQQMFIIELRIIESQLRLERQLE